MRTALTKRSVLFFVQDGCLVRIVAGKDGDDRTYTHRCSKAALETVAHAVNEVARDGQGITLTLLSRQEHLPFTQVNVALEFLKERGLVDVRHRRCYPASTDVFLDAMVEYHALAEAVY